MILKEIKKPRILKYGFEVLLVRNDNFQSLNVDLIYWLVTNVGPPDNNIWTIRMYWSTKTYKVYFSKKEDAMAFKLCFQ